MKIRPPDPPPSDALTNEQFDRWWSEIGEDELRQILYWKWDPIGVSGYFPDCKNEYDRYGREIITKLRSGGTVDDVANRLLHFQTVKMAGGLALGGKQGRLEVAEAIWDWFERSPQNWLDLIVDS